MNDVVALILVVVLTLTLLVYHQSLRVDPFSPRSLFIYTFSIFYIVDLIVGLTYYSNQIFLAGYVYRLKQDAAAELGAFYACIMIFMVFTFRGKVANNLSDSVSWDKSINMVGTRTQLSISIIFNIVCLFLLASIIIRVGVIEYFGNLSLRATLFSDTTIVNALASASITFSGIVVAAYSLSDKPKKILIVMSVLSILILAALMAARAVLIELIFTYLFIRHHGGRTFKIKLKHVFYFIIVAATLVELAFQTRVTADGDQKGILNRIFLTEQVPQSENGLIYLSGSNLRTSNSVFQSSISWIPRGLLEEISIDKGNGGNADFTAAYLPHRWFDQNSQISLGGINELLINYGFIGGLVFFYFLFLLINFIYKKLIKSRHWCLLSIPLAWSVFQLNRGDFFHTINKAAISIAIILLIILVSRIGAIKRGGLKWREY